MKYLAYQWMKLSSNSIDYGIKMHIERNEKIKLWLVDIQRVQQTLLISLKTCEYGFDFIHEAGEILQ